MKKAGNLDLVRRLNTSIILEALKSSEPMTRNDLAKATGLSSPTVTKITNDLIELGIVQDIGTRDSSGGRPPSLIELNKDGGFVVGVNIGNTHITSIAVNFAGEIIKNISNPLPSCVNDLSILSTTLSTIAETISSLKKTRSQLFGIGVGVFGNVDPEEGIIIHASNISWENVPIRSILADAYNVPIYVDESTRLLCFAEKWFGSAKQFENILCLRIGDDIDACLMLNGQHFGGSQNLACNRIHKIVISEKNEYSNGTVGSLLTTQAIANHITYCLSTSDRPSKLRDISDLSYKTLVQVANSGDPLAESILDDAARHLAALVNNICRVADPEIVIIGGGLAKADSTFFTAFHNHLLEFSDGDFDNLMVIPSMLNDDAYAIGAAGILLHHIFSNPLSFSSRN